MTMTLCKNHYLHFGRARCVELTARPSQNQGQIFPIDTEF